MVSQRTFEKIFKQLLNIHSLPSSNPYGTAETRAKKGRANTDNIPTFASETILKKVLFM